nr:hypothetical protein [Tanacetum cinerariifolium]
MCSQSHLVLVQSLLSYFLRSLLDTISAPTGCLAAAKTIFKHLCCSRKGGWLLLKHYPNTTVATKIGFGKDELWFPATTAFDKGKGDDTFGIKDEDWQLFKKMNKDNDDEDEGPNEDETYLARVDSKLRKEYAQWIVASQRSLLHP